MSITLFGSKLIATGIIGLGMGAGAVGISATNPNIIKDVENIQSSLLKKDYEGFKSANIQLATNRVNSITQDDFNKLSDRAIKAKATQDAVANNDYNAFKANATEKMLERVDTQAKFDVLVKQYSERKVFTDKISDSVKNNDFNAFKQAKLDMYNKRPRNDRKNTVKATPTDEQLQSQFDKLVANYKADGTLPSDLEDNIGFGGGRLLEGKNHGKHGGHGIMNDTNDDNSSSSSVSSNKSI